MAKQAGAQISEEAPKSGFYFIRQLGLVVKKGDILSAERDELIMPASCASDVGAIVVVKQGGDSRRYCASIVRAPSIVGRRLKTSEKETTTPISRLGGLAIAYSLSGTRGSLGLVPDPPDSDECSARSPNEIAVRVVGPSMFSLAGHCSSQSISNTGRLSGEKAN